MRRHGPCSGALVRDGACAAAEGCGRKADRHGQGSRGVAARGVRSAAGADRHRHHRRLRRLFPARGGERQRHRPGDHEHAQGGCTGDRLLRAGRRSLRQGPAGRHRGAYSKESSGDLVLACLGTKELSGSVSNTRLAVRKNRGGKQGQEYLFQLRVVEAPEKDEDGDPITTMVVDWLPPGTASASSTPDDPWAKPKRQDQRTAVLRLKGADGDPGGPGS